MWPKYQVTAKSISQNKNAGKRRHRIALRYEQFKSLDHIADNIYRIAFAVEDKEVIFITDLFSPKWVVSECDDYIIGSGVIKKCFDVEA